MQDLIEHITNEDDLILQINLVFMLLFILVTIFFVTSILYLRYQKIIKEKRTRKLNDSLSEFINIYLFDDSLKPTDIKDFQTKMLKTSLDQKIAIKALLIFEENFKGDTNSMIRELFFAWELDVLTERDLKSGIWYKVARAIYVSSEIGLTDFEKLIETYLNSEREEVRQQAILYFITISKENPLNFLDKIQTPITLWEQIYIEECLKTKYSGPVPDFSNWLQHPMVSVRQFTMKMISEYNQFQHIEALVPFLYSKNKVLRNTAIENLAQMEYYDLLAYSKKTFDSQPPKTKKIILKVLKRIGSTEDFLDFENRIPAEDWMNLQVFNKLKAEYTQEPAKVSA